MFVYAISHVTKPAQLFFFLNKCTGLLTYVLDLNAIGRERLGANEPNDFFLPNLH
jgi:hypothetical protein